ncbi:hypothetical protein PV328_010354 [Microctonus aethiopoides]|uniref:Uncharacterized protein n=1 Tax=Microctonus aethiopoides TaxID=144406 RepID=A0AA39FHJ4_9HYME|nr:hypothetical protein PV328_010354 [Microctonus aethiopoides]
MASLTIYYKLKEISYFTPYFNFHGLQTPVLTAPLTKSSPDTGPTIIQHEAVTVYNSVKKKVRDVIDFLHEALLVYTKEGLKLLKKRYHELPLILGGDFNIQFDTDEGLRCVHFLKKELNLNFVSGNTLGTTRHDSVTREVTISGHSRTHSSLMIRNASKPVAKKCLDGDHQRETAIEERTRTVPKKHHRPTYTIGTNPIFLMSKFIEGVLLSGDISEVTKSFVTKLSKQINVDYENVINFIPLGKCTERQPTDAERHILSNSNYHLINNLRDYKKSRINGITYTCVTINGLFVKRFDEQQRHFLNTEFIKCVNETPDIIFIEVTNLIEPAISISCLGTLYALKLPNLWETD